MKRRFRFVVELQGEGDDEDAAWIDACDAFAIEPGEFAKAQEIPNDDDDSGDDNDDAPSKPPSSPLGSGSNENIADREAWERAARGEP
jgi:hypothetical protein